MKITAQTLPLGVAALLLPLAACSNSSPLPEAQSSTEQAGPERIVALSTDAAVALHQLGVGERLVAAPASLTSPVLSHYSRELTPVATLAATEGAIEPEQILALEPDLVVVTARHTGEEKASALLEASGVELLVLDNGWSGVDEVSENLEAIGKATGTSKAAAALSAEIVDGVEEVSARSAEAQERPEVAILSNQTPMPLLNDATGLVSEMLEAAGGTNVAASAGVPRSMPVQPEQLVRSAPERLMLIDVTGQGLKSFDALLRNPAVAALPAVREGRVELFAAKDVYGLSGREVATGAEAIQSWLHPDLAR